MRFCHLGINPRNNQYHTQEQHTQEQYKQTQGLCRINLIRRVESASKPSWFQQIAHAPHAPGWALPRPHHLPFPTPLLGLVPQMPATLRTAHITPPLPSSARRQAATSQLVSACPRRLTHARNYSSAAASPADAPGSRPSRPIVATTRSRSSVEVIAPRSSACTVRRSRRRSENAVQFTSSSA